MLRVNSPTKYTALAGIWRLKSVKPWMRIARIPRIVPSPMPLAKLVRRFLHLPPRTTISQIPAPIRHPPATIPFSEMSCR